MKPKGRVCSKMWGHHVIFSTCVYFTCEPRKKSCITMAPKLLHCAIQKLISLFSFLVSIQFFPTMSSVTLGFHCLDRWELANSCLFTISFINWGKCHSGVFLLKMIIKRKAGEPMSQFLNEKLEFFYSLQL